MGTFHPAALLRNPANKPAALEDFQKLREKSMKSVPILIKYNHLLKWRLPMLGRPAIFCCHAEEASQLTRRGRVVFPCRPFYSAGAKNNEVWAAAMQNFCLPSARSAPSYKSRPTLRALFSQMDGFICISAGSARFPQMPGDYRCFTLMRGWRDFATRSPLTVILASPLCTIPPGQTKLRMQLGIPQPLAKLGEQIAVGDGVIIRHHPDFKVVIQENQPLLLQGGKGGTDGLHLLHRIIERSMTTLSSAVETKDDSLVLLQFKPANGEAVAVPHSQEQFFFQVGQTLTSLIETPLSHGCCAASLHRPVKLHPASAAGRARRPTAILRLSQVSLWLWYHECLFLARISKISVCPRLKWTEYHDNRIIKEE